MLPEQVAVRQGVPALASASPGHAAALPVHVSATSHAPALGRHSVPEATNASAGHAVESTEQCSATSHEPAADRHSVAVAATSWVHEPLLEPPKATLQAWQSAAPSPHAVSQHTPSTQWPDAHSSFAVQKMPGSDVTLKYRAVPLSIAAESSLETPTSRCKPFDETASEKPNASSRAVPLASSSGPALHVAPLRRKALTVPASTTVAVSSKGAPTKARLPSPERATESPN